jgi:hypothetical protein
MKNNNTKVGTVAFLVFVLLMLKQRRDQQRHSRYQWFESAYRIATADAIRRLDDGQRQELSNAEQPYGPFDNARDTVLWPGSDVTKDERIATLPPVDEAKLLSIINDKIIGPTLRKHNLPHTPLALGQVMHLDRQYAEWRRNGSRGNPPSLLEPMQVPVAGGVSEARAASSGTSRESSSQSKEDKSDSDSNSSEDMGFSLFD